MDWHDQKLIAYYNKFPEEKRLDSRHGQVEYRLTRHFINQAISDMGAEGQSLRVLDIGAGTGRYAGPLAGEGHRVTAVELVRYNIGCMRQKWTGLDIRQGDARDLAGAGLGQECNGSFDLILMLGPMYHLIRDQDKAQALAEAARLLAPRGRLLVAYLMNEYSVLTYGFGQRHILELRAKGQAEKEKQTQTERVQGEQTQAGRLQEEQAQEGQIQEKRMQAERLQTEGVQTEEQVQEESDKIGSFSRDHRSKGSLDASFALQPSPGDLYDYVRLEDIAAFDREANRLIRGRWEKAGRDSQEESLTAGTGRSIRGGNAPGKRGAPQLIRERIFSPDGPANYMRRELNALSEEEFACFLDYQLAICERADLLGAGGHLVEVLRLSEK